MEFPLKNKWKGDKVRLVLPELPKAFSSCEGIVPCNLTLDPKIGTETVLLYFDRTPFIYEIAEIRPFDFLMKSGLIRTSHGPVLFHLFYVPDPNNSSEPFVAVEAFVNPLDPEFMQKWRDIARQSHWHLVLVGKQNEVVDFFEFENTFDLGETLDQVEHVCESMTGESFEVAKDELYNLYSVMDLYRM